MTYFFQGSRKILSLFLLPLFFSLQGCIFDPVRVEVVKPTPAVAPVKPGTSLLPAMADPGVLIYTCGKDIYTSDANYKTPVRITSDGLTRIGLKLSPDRQKFACLTGGDAVEVMDLQGKVLYTTKRPQARLSWSADGKTLCIYNIATTASANINYWGDGPRFLAPVLPTNALLRCFSPGYNNASAYGYSVGTTNRVEVRFPSNPASNKVFTLPSGSIVIDIAWASQANCLIIHTSRGGNFTGTTTDIYYWDLSRSSPDLAPYLSNPRSIYSSIHNTGEWYMFLSPDAPGGVFTFVHFATRIKKPMFTCLSNTSYGEFDWK